MAIADASRPLYGDAAFIFHGQNDEVVSEPLHLVELGPTHDDVGYPPTDVAA